MYLKQIVKRENIDNKNEKMCKIFSISFEIFRCVMLCDGFCFHFIIYFNLFCKCVGAKENVASREIRTLDHLLEFVWFVCVFCYYTIILTDHVDGCIVKRGFIRWFEYFLCWCGGLFLWDVNYCNVVNLCSMCMFKGLLWRVIVLYTPFWWTLICPIWLRWC